MHSFANNNFNLGCKLQITLCTGKDMLELKLADTTKNSLATIMVITGIRKGKEMIQQFSLLFIKFWMKIHYWI